MPERPSYFDDKCFIPWPTTPDEWTRLVRAINPDPVAVAQLAHDFPEFTQRKYPTPASQPAPTGLAGGR